MSKFVAFLSDETGASAAEYVLILAIIGTTIAVAIGTFGNAIGTALTGAANAIGALKFTAS
jgi:pilus assembly protein Flp/PilA